MTNTNSKTHVWVYKSTKQMIDSLLDEIPVKVNQDDVVRIAIKNLKKEFDNDPTIILSEVIQQKEKAAS